MMPRPNSASWVSTATVAGVALALGSLVATACGRAPSDEYLQQATVHLRLESCDRGLVNRATGVRIDDGFILSVGHTFANAQGLLIEDHAGQPLASELVYLDQDRDIAVLRTIESGATPAVSYPSITLDQPGEGAEVRFVGYRDRDKLAIHDATIVRYSRVTFDGEGDRSGIELHATIRSGDSGAPVVNSDGEILGLVFATTTGSDTGWAVASSELRQVLDDLATDPNLTPLPLTCEPDADRSS